MKEHSCTICGERFTDYPCDAHPVTKGTACPRCDDLIVTPVRILLVRGINIIGTINQAIAIHRNNVAHKAKFRKENRL